MIIENRNEILFDMPGQQVFDLLVKVVVRYSHKKNHSQINCGFLVFKKKLFCLQRVGSNF